MRFHHRLRTRIVLSYSLLGVLLGLFLGLFLLIALERQERALMNAYIADELTHFVALSGNRPDAVIHPSRHATGYKVTRGALPPRLAFLANLQSGIHELEHEGRGYDIGVTERVGARYYLLYDDTRLERFERRVLVLLAVAVLLSVIAAVAYGFWLSMRVIEPITQLARQVSVQDQTGEPLVTDYADDEIGMLADAFDRRVQRLAAFVQRERDFTADASHELRTPLTVIRAVCEGLLAHHDLADDFRRKLRRIERAAEAMTERLDVLLILARESPSSSGLAANTGVAPVLAQAIEDHRHLLSDPVWLELQVHDEGSAFVAAPPVVVSMLIGNVLQNAFKYTRSGRIAVVLDRNSLSVTDTGPGVDADEIPQLFDRGYRGRGAIGNGSGLGLSIVGRLCEHYGWSLTVTPGAESGVCIRWRFSCGRGSVQRLAGVKRNNQGLSGHS